MHWLLIFKIFSKEETMSEIYNEIKDHFRDYPDVEIAEGKGAQEI